MSSYLKTQMLIHVPQFIQRSYHLAIQNLLLSGNIQQNGCIRPTSRHCKMLISLFRKSFSLFGGEGLVGGILLHVRNFISAFGKMFCSFMPH